MRKNKNDFVITKARKARYQAAPFGDEKVTRLQAEIAWATAEATPSLTDIATDAGISDATLSSWRRGLRVPPPDALFVLADVLEEQARRIENRARQLARAAEELQTPEGREAWLMSYATWRDQQRSLSREPEAKNLGQTAEGRAL